MLKRALSHRRAPLVVVLLALALASTSLWAGLVGDDYIHALILRGSTEIAGFSRHPLDLFRFASPEVNASLVAEGLLPWWAHPSLTFAFFRPLTAATHWLDYAVFDGSAVAMHAHGLVWLGLSLAAAGLFYRTTLGATWIAVLALAFYAFDGARGQTLSWIANRNALVGVTLSLLTLHLHARGTDGSRWQRWTAPAVLAVALLAAEGSIATGAYLAAHAAFLDERPLRARALSLLPYLLIAGIWVRVHHHLGYGVSGSGEYFDPFRDPALFLGALPERALVLLFSELGGPLADAWNAYPLVSPALPAAVLAAAALAVGFAGWLAAPLLRSSRTSRFFLAGCLLSLFPAVSAFPSDRLLSWVSIGAMGLLSELSALAVEGRWSGVRKWGALAILGYHLGLSPLTLPARAASAKEAREILSRGDASLPRSDDVTGKTLLFVTTPSEPMVSFLPAARAAEHIPRPRAQHWLTAGTSPVTVRRPGERVLEVTSESFVRAQTERMLRGPQHPFSVGERVELPGIAVEVLRLTGGSRPLTVRFTFDHPLEDPRYLWVRWKDDGFVPFTLPTVGETIELPPIDILRALLGPSHPLTRLVARQAHDGPSRTPGSAAPGAQGGAEQ